MNVRILTQRLFKSTLIFIALICITIIIWGFRDTNPFIASLLPRTQPLLSSPACNYAKRKWVADNRLPFYSGEHCRQWLSGEWSCRASNRTDFSFEKFRWQPFNCQMDQFSVSGFLTRMRNKTLAFIGDSLGRQQLQSLMCMINSSEEKLDVVNVGSEYGLVKSPGAKRPNGWAYRFTITNTTILYYWSSSLCDLRKVNESDPDSLIAVHLDRPPTFLTGYIDRFNIVVLNTGHHWNEGKINAHRWVMYEGGFPTPEKSISDSKDLAMHSTVKWVNSEVNRRENLRVFLRSMSPSHFFNGDWDSGGTCGNLKPLSRGGEVLKDGSSDLSADVAVKGTNLTLLDITALSELRDEGHISKYSKKHAPGMEDCVHWCLPGIPDTWNEILFAHLSK